MVIEFQLFSIQDLVNIENSSSYNSNDLKNLYKVKSELTNVCGHQTQKLLTIISYYII